MHIGENKTRNQIKNDTRLTYNCAHLILNNKKNTNKMSQNGLRDLLGEMFLGENSLDDNFWGEGVTGVMQVMGVTGVAGVMGVTGVTRVTGVMGVVRLTRVRYQSTIKIGMLESSGF